jgi:hypothetical protein
MPLVPPTAALGVIGNGCDPSRISAVRRAVARYSMRRKIAGDRVSVADAPPRGTSSASCPRLNDAHALILNSVLHSRDG